jgi:hypothetical protein
VCRFRGEVVGKRCVPFPSVENGTRSVSTTSPFTPAAAFTSIHPEYGAAPSAAEQEKTERHNERSGRVYRFQGFGLSSS